jgi:3-oxoacyl-[acyl-carrier-protein] synthase III
MPVRRVQHRAIFADGAGGILLQRTDENEESCILGSEFLVLGKYADAIRWPASWSPHPQTIPNEYNGYFYMGESKLLFRLLQQNMRITLKRLWEKTGFKPDDAVEEGRIKRGNLVLLVTYGAGITGGCMLLRY